MAAFLNNKQNNRDGKIEEGIYIDIKESVNSFDIFKRYSIPKYKVINRISICSLRLLIDYRYN